MPDANDMDLMREYADCNSETAFAGLVHRHINLVYSVALRFTGNSPDAQDVTQAVFIVLAQKAARLRQRTTLTGWLYETTRFTARQLLRTRGRQQAREQEAYLRSTLDDPNSENFWRQLAPLLEEAMARLSEKERTLVVLRFFENKSSAETAALLGIKEWSAHKRAARAIEKLRQFFVKRGIASTTAALVGAISANSVQAAPAMLTKAVTASAIAKGAAASTSTLTIVNGALEVIPWSKAKAAIAIGVAAILLAGTIAIVAQHQTRTDDITANSSFPDGDLIEITSVDQNESQMTVKGHYLLVSQKSAQLTFYVTSLSTNVLLDDACQGTNISKGNGDFELIHQYIFPGYARVPHVSMFSVNGKAFADTDRKSTRLNSSHQCLSRMPSSA